MKIRIKTIFSVLLLLAVFTINAQVSIAPKIGLSYSKLGGDFNNSKFMPGAFFGGMFNFPIHELFSFQSGLLLSGKGTTLHYSAEDEDEILISYLEMPLNNILTIQAGSGLLQFFAGPYIGIALNGKYRYLEDENNMVEKLRIGNSTSDEIKPMDAGFNFGTGYLFEGLEVQLAYSRSFLNISNAPNEKLIHNVITISMAYFFTFNNRRSQNRW